MAYLAIRRIFDERLFCLRVLADHIGGAGLDAGPAADAAVDTFYGHGALPLRSFNLLCSPF